jgi:L-idonate 5-dehydrogenase
MNRAGSLLGKRVLVTGCGPIGALCILAAHIHGAREIVATDVIDAVLGKVGTVGADRTINVAADGEKLAAYGTDKGHFDVMFEASGNERAVRSGLDVLKPRGILVQLGLGGDLSIPQNLVVSKEIEMRGTFRFHEEFALAVDLINSRRADVKPLLTGIYPLDDAVAAFDIAGDRSRSMKVQIAF